MGETVYNTMNFGDALKYLKQGEKIARKEWGGYWSLKNIAGFDRPVIVANLKATNIRVPATAYQEDLLAEDWIVL